MLFLICAYFLGHLVLKSSVISGASLQEANFPASEENSYFLPGISFIYQTVSTQVPAVRFEPGRMSVVLISILFMMS